MTGLTLGHFAGLTVDSTVLTIPNSKLAQQETKINLYLVMLLFDS